MTEQLELFNIPNPGEGKTCRHCDQRQRYKSHEKSNKVIQKCGISGKKIKVTDPGCWKFEQTN